MNKFRKMLIGLAAAVLLSACAGGGSGDGVSDHAPSKGEEAANGSISSGNAWGAASAEGSGSDSDSNDNASESGGDAQTADRTVNKEMLVYTCRMSVDVLKFDEAVGSFRDMLKQYGGFVENENYSDDQGTTSYYDEKKEVWHNYTATIRIPSAKYEEFTEKAAGIGNLRSRTSEVKNVSQEYYDAKTELAIYEAKQKRYLALLETIQDEAYAIEVEKQLTEIEIQIAKLKTRMNDIETDVAYSYVYITIHEVRKYQEEPLKTDTFAQRLGNTIRESWSIFLTVAEKMLFVLIYVLPYLVITALIVLVVLLCINRKYHIFRKKTKKQENGTQEQVK